MMKIIRGSSPGELKLAWFEKVFVMCSADRRDYKEAQVGPTDRGGEEASSKKVAHQNNTSIGIIKIAYIY